MKLVTTLNEIRERSPCREGWATLLGSLNKTEADDEPLSIMSILASNGIEDAVWCLRVFDYRDYCLFLADVVEPTLLIYESKHSDDPAPRKAIGAIRKYHAGGITKLQLKEHANAAHAAHAAHGAADVDVSAVTVVDAAYDVYAGAADVDVSAVTVVDIPVDDVYADARRAKWKKIEQLFIEHFGRQP